MKGHYEKQLTASWIQERLKPTHYGVLTLKQGCWVENGDCDSWVKGTRDQFAAEYGEFVKNLTVEFKGRTNFRRHKKLLPNAATLEGDGLGCLSGSWHSPSSRTFLSGSSGYKRAHLNVLMRKPAYISEIKFKLTFERCWREMDWAMDDVFLEERTGDCVGYSLKEGTETLLTDHMSFG